MMTLLCLFNVSAHQTGTVLASRMTPENSILVKTVAPTGVNPGNGSP